MMIIIMNNINNINNMNNMNNINNLNNINNINNNKLTRSGYCKSGLGCRHAHPKGHVRMCPRRLN